MVRFEYFTEEDFEKMIDWHANTSPGFLMQWAGPEFSYPLTSQQLQKYLVDTNYSEAKRFIYRVVDEDSDQVIGHLSLGSIDQEQKSARIGKVIVGDPNARGKGYGEQMIREAVRIAFEDLKLHRVTLGVFDFNEGALRCYQKVGFVIDGLLRDCRRVNEAYWSLYEMSILEDEWQR